MPTCLHGWVSDGINTSGCPQCAELEVKRLREGNSRMHDALERIMVEYEDETQRDAEVVCERMMRITKVAIPYRTLRRK